MTPAQIFSQMSPDAVGKILNHLYEHEKPLYRAAIDQLARKRNLRPIFVERKPRPERHAWMRDAMARKTGETVAAQLLQIWLVRAQSQLLCDFLDALSIKHDDDGTVEELPPEPPREQLESAVNSLVEKHDPEIVSIYLHAFQALNETGWAGLDEILAQDSRLALGGAAARS